MRRNLSLIDVAFGMRWFREAGTRRLVLGVLLIVLALLCVFPVKYVADVKLAPQDTNTAGLSSILSQLGGNYSALLGNHQPVEIDLAIARSFDVRTEVVKRLGLARNDDPRRLNRAIQHLENRSSVRALRAGIIEIEVTGRDGGETLNVASVYAKALQGRLAQLSREQTAYKRKVLAERMQEATDRLTRAEAAVTRFRRENQLVLPTEQLEASVSTLNALRAQYQSIEVELEKTRRFNSEQSFPVTSIRTALTALGRQIAEAEQRAKGTNGFTAGGLAPRALQYQRLDRELRFSQALFESYTRYMEGAAVENLTADFNMQILEPPFIDPEWQFNTIPLVLLVAVGLLALAAEFYVFRPPPGARLDFS